MKKYFKDGCLFFFILILICFKSYIFGLFVPQKNIYISNEYISYIENENKNLNKILNVNYENINYSYGKIIYKNPYGFNNLVNVSVNTENVNKNDLVVSANGLIGKVKYVYKNFVKVSLINDKNFKLNIKVNDCYGILNGNDNIYIDSINNYCQVSVGDIVYSSNLNDNISLKIGIIKNIILDENKISNRYEIELFDNLNDLNYVVVVGIK